MAMIRSFLAVGWLAMLVLLGTPAAAQVLASGSITTAGAVVTVPMTSAASLAVQATGTWVGQLEFQTTADGDTWVSVPVLAHATNAPMQRTTTNGLYVLVNAGYTAMRVRAVVLDSGTVTITAARGFGGVAPVPAVAVAPAIGLPVPLCNPVTRHLKPLGKCS